MEQQKYFHRQIDQALLAWKNSTRHKPLLLRGARQVGKSSTVRHLAEQFDNFVEINFERKPKYLEMFRGDLDAKHIVETIKSITGEPTHALGMLSSYYCHCYVFSFFLSHIPKKRS